MYFIVEYSDNLIDIPNCVKDDYGYYNTTYTKQKFTRIILGVSDNIYRAIKICRVFSDKKVGIVKVHDKVGELSMRNKDHYFNKGDYNEIELETSNTNHFQV